MTLGGLLCSAVCHGIILLWDPEIKVSRISFLSAGELVDVCALLLAPGVVVGSGELELF